jgi:predicted transcriptional regulator
MVPMDYSSRKQLLKRGDISEIARTLGRSVQDVSEHLKGFRKNPAVLKALARKMGLPVRVAFPDYDQITKKAA